VYLFLGNAKVDILRSCDRVGGAQRTVLRVSERKRRVRVARPKPTSHRISYYGKDVRGTIYQPNEQLAHIWYMRNPYDGLQLFTIMKYLRA
jgi:hypothetical protein